MRRSAFEIIYPKNFKWNTLADLREKYSKLRFPVCAHGSGDAPQEHDQAESDQIEAKKEDDDFVWNVITSRCEKAKTGEIPFISLPCVTRFCFRMQLRRATPGGHTGAACP